MSSTGSRSPITRASFAGVSPRESRTSSARGTSTSTSIRASARSSVRHRLGGDVEVEPVRHDEAVDDVELARLASVHPHDDSVLDDELRLGIVGAVRGDEAERRVRGDQLLEVQVAGRARGEPTATRHRRAAPARRRRRRPRGRTPRSPSRPCCSSRSAQASSSRAVARRGRRAVYTSSRSSSGTEASSAARSRFRASCSRPAARATSAWSRNVSGVARISPAESAPERACASVTSSSARPPGVATSSGRFWPSG